jgi:hypothetical protein
MWSATHIVLATHSAGTVGSQAAPAPHPSLDVEMLLGFIAVLATLLCYLERRRSPAARFALGVCLLLTAIFALDRGVWPLALLQTVWAGAAVARWWATRGSRPAQAILRITHQNRRTELFGSTISNN